jgi:hypothetical protein
MDDKGDTLCVVSIGTRVARMRRMWRDALVVRGGATPGATGALAPVHQPCVQGKLGDI